MTKIKFAFLALLAVGAIAALPAHGADPVPSDTVDAVNIVSRINPGDIPYTKLFQAQARLASYLPKEPRLTDFVTRILFAELSPEQRDLFAPANWSVAIVGKTAEHTVPTSRGGYFVLPDLPQMRDEGATVMFNTQTTVSKFGIAWRVHLQGDSMSYQHLARVLEEVRATQDNVPLWRLNYRPIKTATMDGLKACFRTPEGGIDIAGATVARRGMCSLLVFNPALLGSNPTIRFDGALETLTIEESKDW